MPRPLAVIDWEIVDELMEAGCTGVEIASYFGLYPDTLYARVEDKYKCGFSAYLHQKRSVGDALIRKTQFDVAIDKDKTMLIWLGKQRLDQREPEQKTSNLNESAFVDYLQTQLDNYKKSIDSKESDEKYQQEKKVQLDDTGSKPDTN